jgi:hypothetical protein
VLCFLCESWLIFRRLLLLHYCCSSLSSHVVRASRWALLRRPCVWNKGATDSSVSPRPLILSLYTPPLPLAGWSADGDGGLRRDSLLCFHTLPTAGSAWLCPQQQRRDSGSRWYSGPTVAPVEVRPGLCWLS